MASSEDEDAVLRSVVMQNAKSVRAARRRLEQELTDANDASTRKSEELVESEARYRTALKVGRMGYWETDLVAGTRMWSEEGRTLFGLDLDDGRGHVGDGEADELRMALHPDDRHLMEVFHDTADRQDSFPTEYRIVRADGTRWLSGRGQVLGRTEDGKARHLLNIVADITERKVAEDHVQFLMNEMRHRTKNLFTVIQAIAHQTASTSGTTEEFQRRFAQRLQGLSTSHDLLVAQNWQGASLGELVREQLAPFARVGGTRVKVSGPTVFVSAAAAEAIGLALHELATNAVKHGALSAASGQVTVSWAIEDGAAKQRQLRMSWVEQDGPSVTPPTRSGFGRTVMEAMLVQRLDGKVTMNFAPGGLTWDLSIPADQHVTPARRNVAKDG